MSLRECDRACLSPLRGERQPQPAPAPPLVAPLVAPEAGASVALDPPCHVLVHNDDVTPYDFVIVVLAGVFDLTWPRAREVTQTAHTTGVAHVVTLPLEEAKYRVGNAHAAARLAGYPLAFSLEPA